MSSLSSAGVLAAGVVAAPTMAAAFSLPGSASAGLSASQVAGGLAKQPGASKAEPAAAWARGSLAACGGAGLVGAAIAVAGRRTAGLGPLAPARKFVSAAAFESEVGVQAPLGYWDPLGLAKDGDQETFKRRRATELKHGRVAMYAAMGYMLPEYFRFPGYLSPSEGLKFEDVPNGLEALSKVPLNGWLQIVLFCGLYEFPTYNSDRAPGDLGWKPITSTDPDTLKRKLNAELANGRLAMVAIMGMLFQNGTVGSTGPEMWLPAGAFESELGVQPPTGFWDPAGIASDGDEADFRQLRMAEIKHGRVSMLACMGYIAPEFFRFPGDLSPTFGLRFADVPNGLAAFAKVPAGGWLQIFAFAGLIELGYFQQEDSRAPGDFKNAGVLGVPNAGGSMQDAEARRRKLNSELANGRLAMMAIIGMFFQDGLTGSAWGDWALYTNSPLRAFEGELGVQAPVGFFDPLGLSKDGDTSAFRRRRVSEIKHGRVAMLACLGYIVPEYTKFPGYLSPSQSLEFSSVPNGLAALSTVPGAGLVQILLFAGVIEKGLYQYDESRAPGDYENGGVLGVPNGSTLPEGEGRTRKLQAELANGRLAMMAIIGMFFQDGLTGSAWGDWELYTDSPLRAVLTKDEAGRFRFATGDGVVPVAQGAAAMAPAGAVELGERWNGEVGGTQPLCNPKKGITRWDPLGFSTGKNAAKFDQYRQAELKHGRVAMTAIIGFIAQHYVHFRPFSLGGAKFDFDVVPDGVGAMMTYPGSVFFGLLFIGAGIEELREKEEGEDPWGSDPYGFQSLFFTGWVGGIRTNQADLNLLKSYELEHGRLAMLGAMGTLAAEYVTGYDAVGQWDHAGEGMERFLNLCGTY